MPRFSLALLPLLAGVALIGADVSTSRAVHAVPVVPLMDDAAVRQAALASDAIYRSCRRQVRKAVGWQPRVRFRMPRSASLMIDRCVRNGGIYS